MKKILKLKLNKATIATLNDLEKSSIQGGCATYVDPISCLTDSKDGYISCDICKKPSEEGSDCGSHYGSCPY